MEASDKHTAVKDILSHEPRWQLGGPDLWGQVPESFKNEVEARRRGCQCDFIKTTDRKTGLLKLSYGQGAWISRMMRVHPGNSLSRGDYAANMVFLCGSNSGRRFRAKIAEIRFDRTSRRERNGITTKRSIGSSDGMRAPFTLLSGRRFTW